MGGHEFTLPQPGKNTLYTLVHPQGKLEPFLSIAGQTMETFIKFLNDEAKPQQSYNSKEHHLVLALAGVITSEGTEFVFTTSSI